MTMEFLHGGQRTSDLLMKTPSDLCLTALRSQEFLVKAEGDKVPIIVDQKVIDGYIKSFNNLKANGACNQQTLDAFKKACEFLPRLNQAGLQKIIDAAAKDKDVDTELVVRHIYEILKSSKFSDVKPMSGDKESGNFIVKNSDEIYVAIDFNKVPDKAKKPLPPGAGVSIEFKNGIPKKE